MKYNDLIICILLFGVIPLSARDQDTLKQYSIYHSLNVSYVFGGQVYNDNFLYNPGYAINYSAGKKITGEVSAGIGGGYMPLKNGKFFPVYIEITGNKKKKDNTPFIRFQGGYAYAVNNSASAKENYSLKGGLYINAGLGRKIKINDQYTLLFHWSYCHQMAKMEYEIFGGRRYSEILNYDMLQISLGLLFN